MRCLFLEVDAKRVTLAQRAPHRDELRQVRSRPAPTSSERAGERSVWLHAQLHDADFTHAILPRAQLMEASALRACFRRAILVESRCYRASFEHADFTESQLFGVDFSKCALGRARVHGRVPLRRQAPPGVRRRLRLHRRQPHARPAGGSMTPELLEAAVRAGRSLRRAEALRPRSAREGTWPGPTSRARRSPGPASTARTSPGPASRARRSSGSARRAPTSRARNLRGGACWRWPTSARRGSPAPISPEPRCRTPTSPARTSRGRGSAARSSSARRSPA